MYNCRDTHKHISIQHNMSVVTCCSLFEMPCVSGRKDMTLPCVPWRQVQVGSSRSRQCQPRSGWHEFPEHLLQQFDWFGRIFHTVDMDIMDIFQSMKNMKIQQLEMISWQTMFFFWKKQYVIWPSTHGAWPNGTIEGHCQATGKDAPKLSVQGSPDE